MTELDFKSKSVDDRLWVLFQLITKIDKYGCDWSGSHRYGSWLKKLSVLGISIGTGFGLVFIVGKLIKFW